VLDVTVQDMLSCNPSVSESKTMTNVGRLRTSSDFWSQIVVPDYQQFLGNIADLRAALHVAISLCHMSDWVFHSHHVHVTSNFTFYDKQGASQAVSSAETFANSLEQSFPDFGRVRGIANAAKHLKLRATGIRPVSNAPSHAANTFVKSTGYGVGGYGQGPFGGGSRVVLEGHNDLEFSQIASSVFFMWETLKSNHGW